MCAVHYNNKQGRVGGGGWQVHVQMTEMGLIETVEKTMSMY